MKQKTFLKLIYKVHSKQLRKSKWDLNLPLETAMREQPELIVSLGDRMLRLNAMRIFYNKFVTNCKFDESHPHDITDVLQMEDIVADYDFIEAFNKAISPTVEKFDFTNAYADTMGIVSKNKRMLRNQRVFNDYETLHG